MGNSLSSEQPLRVMMVGDSMTQGQEGDWTWRYRLWEWLTDQGVAFQLVGPWKGTQAHECPGHETGPGPKATGGYAKDVSKKFTGHHFSAWGRALCQDMDIIKDEVAEHKPDILLVMLGFNDLGWFISDAKGTFASMQTFIKSARAANPNIKLALANIPQRRFMDGREDLVKNTTDYNTALQKAIPTWTTEDSPIKLVHMAEIYQCGPDACPGGYDGLHPNALGDYGIAKAFSQTLVKGFGIGNHELIIPDAIPRRPVDVPRNIKAVPKPGHVIRITWDRVYGAYGYDVQHRTKGMKGWHFNVQMCESQDVMFLEEGEEIECRLRMTCGEDLASDWSNIVSAIAREKP